MRAVAGMSWLVFLGAASWVALAMTEPGPSRGFGAVIVVYVGGPVVLVSALVALGLAAEDLRKTGSSIALRAMGTSGAIALLLAGTVLVAGWLLDATTRPVERPQPPLHAACEAGDLARVRALLAEGASPDERDPSGHLPVVYAAEHGSVAMLEALEAHGARFDDVPAGRAAGAVQNPDRAVLPWLLERGAPIEPRHLELALGIAACQPDDAAMRALLAAGAPPEAGFEAALECHRADSLPMFEVSPEIRTRALFLAVETRETGSVVALLEGGADPNATREGGERALALAIDGERGILDALLDHGARLDEPVWDEQWPLELAIDYGRPDAVAHLIERGASLPGRDLTADVRARGARAVAAELIAAERDGPAE